MFLINSSVPIFINNHDKTVDGEWFNGKTAAFKVADLGSNPCSPAIGTTKVNPVNENEGTRVV